MDYGITPEIVDGPENLRVVKDTDIFGGPNKWHLEVKMADGWWESFQWMDVYAAERIIGKTLPKYEEAERRISRSGV